MPYISVHLRRELDIRAPENGGELNYKITDIVIDYLTIHNNYQGINDVLGALEGAKLEMYRRWAVPYEDYKISTNGDVYPTGEDDE